MNILLGVLSVLARAGVLRPRVLFLFPPVAIGRPDERPRWPRWFQALARVVRILASGGTDRFLASAALSVARSCAAAGIMNRDDSAPRRTI